MESDTPAIEQHPPHPASAANSMPATDQDSIALQLIRELREQRQLLQSEHRIAAMERKSERRWRFLFQFVFVAGPVLLGMLYFGSFLGTSTWHFGPFRDVVGVVHIDGQIAAGAPASADKVIPVLERAFGDAHVKGIVIAIDSPGGAPVESERITRAIDMLKKKSNKPVIAVISNLGASAAYMIAMHTDKVVAAKYSLVGSIGAIIAPWQLDKAIAKIDVSQRIYASGKLKAFLNPFTPVSPEMDAKAQKLVDQMGQTFLGELKATRGAFLKPNVDYGSGEVWGGQEAKDLGLVDEIGTVDDVARSTWALDTFNFGPHADGFGAIASSVGSHFAAGVEQFVIRSSLSVR